VANASEKDETEDNDAPEEGADEEEESSGSDSESDSDSDSDEESDSDSEEDADADSESDSDSEEEADDEEAPAAKKEGAAPRSGKKKKRDGLSPGARLAAARAAKAARKAAKRGKEKKQADPVAQVRESKLAQQAEKAGGWLKEHRMIAIGVGLVALLGLGGWVGWNYYRTTQATAAGALLQAALEISTAQIRAADAPVPEGEEDDEDRPGPYGSVRERARAALNAYKRVTQQYPTSDAAPWALLGQGRALAELGRHDQARAMYERAIAESGDDAAIVWRALEGKAFTYEAEEEWDEAIAAYRQLQSLDGRRFEPIARYHLGRMQLAKGQRREATDTFRALVEQLRSAADDEERQDYEYVLAQAEVRLRELDPSAAPPPPRAPESPFGMPDLENMDPAQREAIIEMLRQMQQQGGGEAPPP
jgi:hypothetical protein